MGRAGGRGVPECFDEFTPENPGIEVRVNVVSYSTYFDTLHTDVAGGSADDIYRLSNAYFDAPHTLADAQYAANAAAQR